MFLFSDNNSDGEILEELEDGFMIIYNMIFVCTNTYEFFNPHELKDGGQRVLDHNRGVHDVLLHMRANSQPLQTLL